MHRVAPMIVYDWAQRLSQHATTSPSHLSHLISINIIIIIVLIIILIITLIVIIKTS